MATNLKLVPEAQFEESDGRLYYYFSVGTKPRGFGYDLRPRYAGYIDPIEGQPVALGVEGADGPDPWTSDRVELEHRQYWFYAGKLYSTDDIDLTADDVRALLNEAANRRRLKLEKAHALEAMKRDLDDRAKREPIPQDVKITVWQRDGGRCVQCESNESLEFDHIIPLAMGGANTMRNLQLLCEPCNRRKGATLG